MTQLERLIDESGFSPIVNELQTTVESCLRIAVNQLKQLPRNHPHRRRLKLEKEKCERLLICLKLAAREAKSYERVRNLTVFDKIR